jgi:hypothetical protein
VPAHGSILAAPPARLELYIRHRLWRESRVVESLRAGPATVAELVPRVYSDVSSAVFPLAERSLLAHLIKLQRDGRVEEVEGKFRLRGA